MTDNSSSPLIDRRADEIIAFRSSGPVTTGEFLSQAIALSRTLQDRRYVINLLSDRHQYLMGFCAAVIAGQCTLMPPNRQAQTLENLMVEYPDCYTLDDAFFTRGGTENETGNEQSAPDIPSNQLCAIAFTSGSTGTPKPNFKYWETLRAGSVSNTRLLLDEAAELISVVATVPPQHMWGFEMSILLPLFANLAVSYRTPFYPQDITDAIETLPGSRALISSPTHLAALVKSKVQPVEIDWIFSATAPLSMNLAKQMQQIFGAQIIDVFGCSESGIFAARDATSESLWRLAGGFKLEIKKEEVLVHAQHLPEVVALADVIELTGENTFRSVGRRQDMINIAGKRGSLADLNHRLTSIPGVSDGVVFIPEAESKRLAALVVAPELNSSDILTALKLQIDPVFLPRPVYMVPTLPRQETGKLAHKAVIETFEKLAAQNTRDDPAARQEKRSDD